MLGLLIPMYSGPDSAPIAWRDIQAMDRRIPISVIVNPNNGPGRHIYKDYLKIIRQINKSGNNTLGYIPTKNGKVPIRTVRHDLSEYFHKYHVNGIFLDEMTTNGSHKNLRYYGKIVKIAWKIHPGVKIFANPGTTFSKKFLMTGIQTFVEQESSENALLLAKPARWTYALPPQTFAEISYKTPKQSFNKVFNVLSKRNLSWIYVTDGSGGNPYSRLPTYWKMEVHRVERFNHSEENQGNKIERHK